MAPLRRWPLRRPEQGRHGVVPPVGWALNSVAGGLAPGLGVQQRRLGGKEGTGVRAVLGDALREGVQAVVTAFVVQFVQQFHADDFTVGLLRKGGVQPVAGRPQAVRLRSGFLF